jgi:hypothetical protein
LRWAAWHVADRARMRQASQTTIRIAGNVRRLAVVEPHPQPLSREERGVRKRGADERASRRRSPARWGRGYGLPKTTSASPVVTRSPFWLVIQRSMRC